MRTVTVNDLNTVLTELGAARKDPDRKTLFPDMFDYMIPVLLREVCYALKIAANDSQLKSPDFRLDQPAENVLEGDCLESFYRFVIWLSTQRPILQRNEKLSFSKTADRFAAPLVAREFVVRCISPKSRGRSNKSSQSLNDAAPLKLNETTLIARLIAQKYDGANIDIRADMPVREIVEAIRTLVEQHGNYLAK